jgi:hypothetical protein
LLTVVVAAVVGDNVLGHTLGGVLFVSFGKNRMMVEPVKRVDAALFDGLLNLCCCCFGAWNRTGTTRTRVWALALNAAVGCGFGAGPLRVVL